ncbi:pyridoxamine 5'-phosphate oxidase family protein [Ponticaulis sp.]|uniref:pyridoxamine 5'-phosphate oxidase family protein n=1 Tax=Ponticaulis sp. TaxID=2020902 RepID=UPI000B631903|nr:pyridoxamine 5'-phosphate oxidase family protein [Ponticaulis sp.]MAI88930.1 pyridoxamine 5'-phosphate oxidase [Ponticaulis sp.]OUY01617.1 MAG: pyridoxamine 5'-phosphate oxidase [Hyphomonadaceae bacterium TMED5]|tara:strand:- start:50097 stop:50663 length:567 start_codon:yes stop_codon:yes gene_type:complete
MTARYLNTLLSPTARQLQEIDGSRELYAAMEARSTDGVDRLTDREASFIAQRDSFYMASVTEDGWPYVQHRGGEKGFLKVISPHQIAFADMRGNRQFMSAGNVRQDHRVSLFLMDYPNRRRMKLAGRGVYLSAKDAPELASDLASPALRDKAIGAFLIDVLAFDWNCPQYITPRWTADELKAQKETSE